MLIGQNAEVKTLPTLPDLWQTYFASPARVDGIDAWAIVFIARDGSEILVSFANPFPEDHEEVFVRSVSDDDLQTFAYHYKERFKEQLPLRFSFFRPGVDRVLTEYPDWQTFYSAWLNDDSVLVQGNMPLLFDYPSDQEYRAMKLKGADYAGYRRLLVVLYQYRKQQFQRIFIKNIDDTQYEQVRKQLLTLYHDAMPHLILSDGEVLDRHA
jgi:hypothetical protein